MVSGTCVVEIIVAVETVKLSEVLVTVARMVAVEIERKVEVVRAVTVTALSV